MIKSKPPLQDEAVHRARVFFRRCGVARFLLAGTVLFLLAQAISASSVSEYHKRIRQAVTALDSLVQSDETEDASTYDKRREETLMSVRTLLPEAESVEWDGQKFPVNNFWLHQELDKYASTPKAERDEFLKSVTERLQAIEERLAEIERPPSGAVVDKAEESRKLAEFLQRLLRSGRPKKKGKAKARIVLGERLEPDQSALDLLSEAEALARRGELRAAIRKAYIALLVELGERKIISLAQYKTNRDYLRAVREVEPLYGNVKQLTDSFERHWYGFAQATETDWLAFRSAYKQALSR